jgi:hypothetical protein
MPLVGQYICRRLQKTTLNKSAWRDESEYLWKIFMKMKSLSEYEGESGMISYKFFNKQKSKNIVWIYSKKKIYREIYPPSSSIMHTLSLSLSRSLLLINILHMIALAVI